MYVCVCVCVCVLRQKLIFRQLIYEHDQLITTTRRSSSLQRDLTFFKKSGFFTLPIRKNQIIFS